LVLSPTGSIKLGFILREDLLLCSSYLPLGVPNWVPNMHYHTTTGIIEALAPKDDGEDPLDVTVCRQVTTGSEFVFTMLIMHDVECDLEKIMSTYPKGNDGRDKSAKEFLEWAHELATCLALFLVDRNAKRKSAHEQKHTAKGASSSKATGSAT
jgi:hypothetical protein